MLSFLGLDLERRYLAQGTTALLKRVETAVMTCVGAKGLATMRLLGTPFDDHSEALSPLMSTTGTDAPTKACDRGLTSQVER